MGNAGSSGGCKSISLCFAVENRDTPLKKNAPGIKDVAAKANCSIATVSCVLNNRGRIGKATRKRVLDVCRQLGYTPNVAGRNLRSRKTENIGLLFYPSCAQIFENVFYSEIMTGLEEKLAGSGYNLLLAGYNIATQHNEMPKFIREGSVDGIILLGGCPEDFQRAFVQIEKPVLLLDTHYESGSVDSVSTDGFQAEMSAVQYLAQRGHRRIAMLRNESYNYNEEMRMEGFLAGVRRLGIESSCEVIRVQSDTEAADALIARHRSGPPFTAACFVNDDMAFHAMRYLQDAGLSIPNDLSIIGFDNTFFSRAITPSISTFDVDKKLIGSEGAALLLSRIKDTELPVKRVTIPVRFLERDSVRSLH